MLVKVSSDEILDYVLKYVNRHSRFPNRNELIEAGYSREIIRNRFGNALAMRDLLIQETGMKNYITESIYDEDYTANVRKSISKKKYFIVSAFVCGAKVNRKFLNNLRTLATANKGELLLIPILDKQNNSDKFFDHELVHHHIIVDEVQLNSNLLISNIAISARAVDPSSGLPRLGQRNGSTIVGSTKQRLKYVPTGTSSMPHALMSTGVVTDPKYSNSRLFKSKTAKLAEEDHKLGAVVVEIVNDEIFHFRHVEAGPKFEVIDMGVMAFNSKLYSVIPEALVLGDWHSGKTNAVVAKQTKYISQKLRIPKWIVHDIFDGDSINHHDNGKHITRAKKANHTGLSIKKEMQVLAKDLSWMTTFLDSVVVVRSNHDEFLDLYLNTGQYVDDPHNHETALGLALMVIQGHNPLEYGVLKENPDLSNVKWLKRDQSYKVAGIECGHHGDAGANGAKPSIGSLENAYKKAVTGHSHTPQILRDIYVVGTSTDTMPDYGKGGPNSWMNTHCIIYPNGTRQLINLIEGKFTTLL